MHFFFKIGLLQKNKSFLLAICQLPIYALIDARTHIITRTQKLVNTNVTPRLLLQ